MIIQAIKRLMRDRKKVPDPAQCARDLPKQSKWEHKLKVRDKCNEMRAAQGKPPIDWDELRENAK